MTEDPARGLVFVLSGPSGVGKDSTARLVREDGFPLGCCVTATTRPPRPGEVHGKHYYFVDEAEFEAMKRSGRLLEHASVHGRQYGVPLDEVRAKLSEGRDVLITVDPQGARTVRERLPQSILIFLAPPRIEDLVERLRNRGTESREELELRLENARRELDELPRYDYCIVNHRDRLREAAEALKAVITAERLRVHPRTVSL